MNRFQRARALLTTVLVLLFLPASLALADSSIKRIHSTNFGIDQGEIESIKAQMKAAVDGDFLNGECVAIGINSQMKLGIWCL